MKSEVWLMSGPCDRRYPLPIESRFEITARPAYRPDPSPPSLLEIVDAWIWPRIGFVLVPLAFALVVAVAVVQICLHFHPVLP